jgi:hypothetical protein
MSREYFVYWCYSNDGLLYIGCTKHLDVRRYAHSRESAWFAQTTYVRLAGPYERSVARRIEREQIASRLPPYNRMRGGEPSGHRERFGFDKDRLAEAWERSGLSLEQLAERAGVLPAYMQQVLAGRQAPPQLHAARIARVVGVPLGELRRKERWEAA